MFHGKLAPKRNGLRCWFDESTLQQQDDAAHLLHDAHTVRCEFPSGALVDLSDSALERHEGDGSEATFDAIDRIHGRARLIGNLGVNDVRVIAQEGSLTFVETGWSKVGMLNVTVVFAQFRPSTRELFAADSRHALLPFSHNRRAAQPEPIVEQYYGSCRVLE